MASYIQKEKDMLARLKATNYALYDDEYTEKSPKEDALDDIEDSLRNFPEYANIVISQQQRLPIIYARYADDPDTLRYQVTRLDTSRKIKHDACIASIGHLNAISDRLGLEPFMAVDTKDRYAVADAIGDYVNETYNHGIGKGLDGATYQKTSSYDASKVHDRLAGLDEKFGDLMEKDAAIHGGTDFEKD